MKDHLNIQEFIGETYARAVQEIPAEVTAQLSGAGYVATRNRHIATEVIPAVRDQLASSLSPRDMEQLDYFLEYLQLEMETVQRRSSYSQQRGSGGMQMQYRVDPFTGGLNLLQIQ